MTKWERFVSNEIPALWTQNDRIIERLDKLEEMTKKLNKKLDDIMDEFDTRLNELENSFNL